jgi:2-oxopent-4-enoate/cis-2-oxohex-4-enoate hydratase
MAPRITMTQDELNTAGDELFGALRSRVAIAPLTERFTGLTVEDAYRISLRQLSLRVGDGEKQVGKKIGATSEAVQKRFGVQQPDFGFLTDAMLVGADTAIDIGTSLIQPMVEGELGFILKRELAGPGVTAADVIRATECVIPCLEIVDSRIIDWRIKYEDTVADNASSGLVVLGDHLADPRKLDLVTVGMVFEKNGRVVSTGAGAAALGSPARCIAWLANALGGFGLTLKADELLLSGSLVPVEQARCGDHFRVTIGGVGCVSTRFS